MSLPCSGRPEVADRRQFHRRPDPADSKTEAQFRITTSGFFSDQALICCIMEMGIDRILYSVDYPLVHNPPAAGWIKTLPLSAEDREKLLNGNARRLPKL